MTLMKPNEITDPLFEVSMAPSALKSLSDRANATVGIEFELYVPSIEEFLQDNLPEPEMTEQDRRARDFDDVADFFYGDWNSNSDVATLLERMNEDMGEWISAKKGPFWERTIKTEVKEAINKFFDKEDLVRVGLENYLYPNQFYGMDKIESIMSAGLNAPQFNKDQIDQYRIDNPDYEIYEELLADTDAIIELLAKDAIDNPENNQFYAEANIFDSDWEEENKSELENEWLEENNLDTMGAIYDQYNGIVAWPSWDEDTDPADAMKAVAASVAAVTGIPAQATTKSGYGYYAVTTDASLDKQGMEGLEIISPPLPLSQMLEQVEKFKEWADYWGAETDRSTGLHINVSVPKLSRETLDYVKLVLFLGDKYVLDQWDRSKSTYTKSAFDKIESIIKAKPEKAISALSTIRNGLGVLASRIIHGVDTLKFTSVNLHLSNFNLAENRVEFRSPGGDWLNADFKQIENTIRRFVAALEIACDETLYREEYAKKLYKMLADPAEKATKGFNPDPIKVFARYSAGELPLSALKTFISSIAAQRETDLIDMGNYEIMLAPANTQKPMSWNDAITYVSKLNAAGHRDWVLPTIQELKTIYRTKGSSGLKVGLYWTSEVNPAETEESFVLYSYDGTVFGLSQEQIGQARAIRNVTGK